MGSLATLAVSVALTFLRIRQGAAAAGGGAAPAGPDLSQRVSVNGAAPVAKRQLWTLTLMGADAVARNTSLPGACRPLLLMTMHEHWLPAGLFRIHSHEVCTVSKHCSADIAQQAGCLNRPQAAVWRLGRVALLSWVPSVACR